MASPFEPEPPVPAEVLFSAEHMRAPYRKYLITSQYINDKGVLQLPVAGPPGAGAHIVQTNAPFSKRVVSFECERLGEWPVIPAPDPDTAEQTLAREIVIPRGPMLLPDGQNHLYRIDGFYEYLLTTPFSATDNLKAGSPPSDVTPKESQEFDRTANSSDEII